MSRVHDALRRAQQTPPAAGSPPQEAVPNAGFAGRYAAPTGGEAAPVQAPPSQAAPSQAPLDRTSVAGILERIQEVPFAPSADAHLVDGTRPHEAPTEEFRTLRTRLNHMQTLQPIHSLVITSPSPAEGKSFAAVNLALVEANLAGNLTVLADFDFRRPIVHLFQIDRSPGITDYLQGKAELHEIIKKVAGMNLYVMPAGEGVLNPLELLNLRSAKDLLKTLPTIFNWVILDTPPLLFAADANLLSTMCDGTILVVRIGATTFDSVTRAMQSLCENNILGTMVNGARRGELYSKYTYYHSYYSKGGEEAEAAPPSESE
jgi:protein-tyrosine kinase